MSTKNSSSLRHRLFYLLPLIILHTAYAQDGPQKQFILPVKKADTCTGKPSGIGPFILPASLFTYGLLTVKVSELGHQNTEIKKLIWDNNPHRTFEVEDYTLFVPAIAVYGLNIAGLKGRNDLTDRTLIYGLSSALAGGISLGIKATGTELRPDASDKASFPSNHTALAFAAAEFLHQEYKGRLHWSVIAGGYVFAAGTGFMRMYNNKHWFGDVVAGAGIGMLSTRFVYLVYPGIKRLLGRNRQSGKDILVLPAYQDGRIGFTGILRL